jgi:hypothetical protein
MCRQVVILMSCWFWEQTFKLYFSFKEKTNEVSLEFVYILFCNTIIKKIYTEEAN